MASNPASASGPLRAVPRSGPQRTGERRRLHQADRPADSRSPARFGTTQVGGDRRPAPRAPPPGRATARRAAGRAAGPALAAAERAREHPVSAAPDSRDRAPPAVGRDPDDAADHAPAPARWLNDAR